MKFIAPLLVLAVATGCPGAPLSVSIDDTLPSVLKVADAELRFTTSAAATYTVRLIDDTRTAQVIARGEASANEPVTSTLSPLALKPGDYVARVEVKNATGVATSERRFTREPLARATITSPVTTYTVDDGGAIDLQLTVGGDEVRVSVSPALPAFITLDATTGKLSGTAQAFAAQGYTFTAANPESTESVAVTLRGRALIQATFAPPPMPASHAIGSHDAHYLAPFLTTNATSVECFDYATGSFSACSATRPPLPLKATARAGEHTLTDPLRVRLSAPLADAREEIYTPDPARYADVRVYTCDEVVTANETMSALQTRLNRANTICLGDVTIDGPNDAGLVLSAAINRLIGPQQTRARFTQTNVTLTPPFTFDVGEANQHAVIANAHAITTANLEGIVRAERADCSGGCPPPSTLALVNVRFDGGISSGATFGVVRVADQTRTVSIDQSTINNLTGEIGLLDADLSAAIFFSAGALEVKDSTIESDGSAIIQTAVTTPTPPTTTASRSRFRTTYPGQSLLGAVLVRSPASFTDCEVESNYTGYIAWGVGAANFLTVTGGSVRADVASIIVGSNPGGGNIQGQLEIRGTRVDVINDGIILWNGRAVVDDVSFVRLNTADTSEGANEVGSYAVRILNSGGVLANLESNTNDSSYCYEDAAFQFSTATQASVQTPIAGTDFPAAPNTFAFAGQENGGVQFVCP